MNLRINNVPVDDTYCEAFSGMYARFIITARVCEIIFNALMVLIVTGSEGAEISDLRRIYKALYTIHDSNAHNEVVFMELQPIVRLDFQEISEEIPGGIIGRVITGAATKEDAVVLLQCDPHTVFKFADMLRTALVGNKVTYIINRNINFSDRCIGTCKFCAFKENQGFRLTLSEIMDKAHEAVLNGATEVCIQGGLMDDMYLDDYCRILESIKSKYPLLHIHAFSPMEVFHMVRRGDADIKSTLQALKEAGLDTMPGTAAEILVERVRNKICPQKLSVDQWVNVIETAHITGIPTTATMMYGHIETMEERIEHMILIRDVQIRTRGFTEFVPLPFMPYNNPLGEKLIREGHFASTGTDDLMVHALARILLFPHVKNIQASWVKLGKKLAQYALFCGASDLGGTLMEEKISKSAGAIHGENMSPEEFKWIIRSSGREAVQRDTLYRHIPHIKETI